MFKNVLETDCHLCRTQTEHEMNLNYKFGTDTKYIILRITSYGFNRSSNSFYKYNTHISQFDLDDIYIPNQQNIKFKVLAGISHTGAIDYGHYTIYVRNAEKWINISDQQASITDFPPYLENIYALILEII